MRVPTGDVSLGGGVQANGSSGDGGSLGNGEHIFCFRVCVGVLLDFFVCVSTSTSKDVFFFRDI